MEKIWLKSYDAEVPESIDPDAYSSLNALIEECFQKYREQPCCYNMGARLTYQQIDELSQAFAGFLQKECKLETQDRVAIMLPNLLQYPVVMFGILKAKMIVVNVNPLYTQRELHEILKDAGAKCVIVLEQFAHVLEKARIGTQVEKVVIARVGDLLGKVQGALVNFVIKYIKKMIPAWHMTDVYSFKETLKAQYKLSFIPQEVTGSDIAYLQYTGGTTGGIKGAMLTHRNMVANVQQACVWIAPFFKEKMEGGIITALPLYHIFSLLANCLTFFKMGIPNIFITNPRDIYGFVKELERQPFSIITGVNTLFNALLHNEVFKALDFSKFKFTLGGGMAVQKVVADQWKAVTGVPLLEAYGLTETSPAVTINPLYLKEFNGSIGLPLPSTEVKVCDEKGQEVALGETGELLVKGPQVMQGYWNQPEMTNQVLSKDGWLKTGDVVRMDEMGFLYLVERKKDIIIVSGFNVYPNEIEAVIVSLKGVKEVAVVGLQSVEHGEVVKAFVVRSDPTLSEAAIIAHCAQQLTGYKVPKVIEFRVELPKTNVGKVLRKALREEANIKNHENA